jgi:head-tail adaptor
MSLQAGKRNYKLEIQRATETRAEGTNELTRDFVSFLVLWADKLPPRVQEIKIAGEVAASTTLTIFHVLWRRDLVGATGARYRIISRNEGNRIYDIKGVEDLTLGNGLHVGQELTCVARSESEEAAA